MTTKNAGAHFGDRQQRTTFVVVALLGCQAALLAYSATKHSPTMLEPGFLVAGLSHWEFGRFEIFCVNPPLVRIVAALPVMVVGYESDWSGFRDQPGARPEFSMGASFIKVNGKRSIWLFTIARWACIPFSLIGGIYAFLWSRDLWKSELAGLISLVLWCFEPNILAHGELITADCAAASFGLAAAYYFWGWLKQPNWQRACIAGAVLGLAELTKTTWIILFGLWPLLWLISLWMTAPLQSVSIRQQLLQLGTMLCLAVYLLNLGYMFSGTGMRLKSFTFVSTSLNGLKEPGKPGNRFHNSLLGELPVPVPKDYLIGIDIQKKDFEDYGQPSYLRGEWKDGGWWYYYLYGLAVKTPHGTQLMMLLSFISLFYFYRSNQTQLWRDLSVLIIPPVLVFVLVSAQLEFTHHFRYILPSFGFAFVFAGITSLWFPNCAEYQHSMPASETTNFPEPRA